MIQNLISRIIFTKILFRSYKLLIFVQTFQLIRLEVFLISGFLAESLKANENQRQRSPILQYSFAQKILLILQISTPLTLRTTCPRNTAKTPSDPFIINLPENMFLSGVRNNICTAPFLDVEDAVSGCQETVQCNTFSEIETRFLEANVCIFLYISAGKFLFQRRSKILPGGGKLRVG